MASSTVAGHILECGAQCTGGNYSKWRDVPKFHKIGYPIVKINSDGYFEISKPKNSGGIINKYTISEQILYELGNPKEYISPDVCVDFTSFKIHDMGNDVVSITGVRGRKPTNTYKVSLSYFNGFKSTGQMTVSGPDAIEKAYLVADIIWKRLKDMNANFKETSTELVGLSSCHKELAKMPNVVNEVVLRLGVKGFCRKSIIKFTKELSPLITSGPPGITGFSEGRPKIREIIAFWPALLDKKLVKTRAII